MVFFRVFFPFGNIAFHKPRIAESDVAIRSLTARAGMDIYRAGYIGHGMLPTGLNRSRYVAHGIGSDSAARAVS